MPEQILFPVITGISAGAINAAHLAANAAHLRVAAQNLCELWSQLKIDQVLDTDLFP
jgi:predicted acylesterase/phospholipase RssA